MLDLLHGKDTVNARDHAVIALGANHFAQTVALVCLSGRSGTTERFGADPDIGCGYLMPGPDGGDAARLHAARLGRLDGVNLVSPERLRTMAAPAFSGTK